MNLKRWAVDEQVPGHARAIERCRHWTAQGAHHCVRARMHTDLDAIAFARDARERPVGRLSLARFVR